ncbi:MAG: N-acetylneuraminate synthase family protein [Vicinamibacterales bacterium]
MSRELVLGGVRLGPATAPYVIAEIGVNHEGSLAQAKRLIELAHEGGAQAAKFQSYKAETLASRNSPAYWDTAREPTPNQYELFKRHDSFGRAEYGELAAHCDRVGIQFLSTPFDAASVEFLAPLQPCVKIASADLTNVPLLRQVGRLKKPVLLSTGASTLAEIAAAVAELGQAGSQDVVLLHCVLNYPTPDEQAHLGMIEGLQAAFPDRAIGYSDHTVPDDELTALLAAYLLGARVLEKHFTHDKSLPGNDHYHAMDVDDLRRFAARLGRVRTLLGASTEKEALDSEAPARAHARRSLVVARSLSASHVLGPEDLIPKRPGTGISPQHWDEIIGRRTRRPLEADEILRWEDLETA